MVYISNINSHMSMNDEIRYLNKRKKFINNMLKRTRLTLSEIKHLVLIYYEAARLNPEGIEQGMRITDFVNVLHCGLDMTNKNLIHFVTSALAGYFYKTVNYLYIPLKVWVLTINLFLRGTLVEKIDFAFEVYKHKSHLKNLTKQQIIYILEDCIMDNDEEVLRDFVDIALKKMDRDRDLTVSYDDFKTTVIRVPELLEVFGSIYPTRYALDAFMTTFTFAKILPEPAPDKYDITSISGSISRFSSSKKLSSGFKSMADAKQT